MNNVQLTDDELLAILAQYRREKADKPSGLPNTTIMMAQLILDYRENRKAILDGTAMSAAVDSYIEKLKTALPGLLDLASLGGLFSAPPPKAAPEPEPDTNTTLLSEDTNQK